MKVLISWSGDESRRVAEVLHLWLPRIIQSVQVFMSSKDIQKGKRWPVELGQCLEEAEAAILCMAADNLNSRWLLFEAGAISKNQNALVIPYLNNLGKSEVELPLSQFQLTTRDRDEILEMFRVINANQISPVSEKQLQWQFDRNWSALSSELESVIESSETSIDGDTIPTIRLDRDVLEEILELLREQSRTPKRTVPESDSEGRPRRIVGYLTAVGPDRQPETSINSAVETDETP